MATAKPCDADGNFLPENASPSVDPPRRYDWSPFESRVQFEVAELLYIKARMSGKNINELFDIWYSSFLDEDLNQHAPFTDRAHLLATIDQIEVGDAPWHAFSIRYNGNIPETNAPKWMTDEYLVCYRDPDIVVDNFLDNPDFDGQFDCVAFEEYELGDEDNRIYSNYMSGGFANEQSDVIGEDLENEGAMFVPLIIGSDKTTVSVATGQNDFYPVYLSIGNVHNTVRRGHRNAVAVIAFLAIPNTDKKHENSDAFRMFRRQLHQSSFSKIFASMKTGMAEWKVRRCPDKHFRRTITGFGGNICDYPDQVAQACIVQGWCPKCFANHANLDGEAALPRRAELVEALVKAKTLNQLWKEDGILGNIVPFMNDFPRGDVYRIMTPDLLHQVIKGAFKDHLVKWICLYLENKFGEAKSNALLAEMDRRIAAVPAFANLRRFAEGRGFKQWTGDDSKALMKVYLPAIRGIVPDDMVRAIRSFMDFCYLARRNVINKSGLKEMQKCLNEFRHYRKIFIITGVRKNFNLPRQHAIFHFVLHIMEFAAPNGLCTSITESKHIVAVKRPWRSSNKNQPLKQMLLTNQRFDKMAAARVNFSDRGMLKGSSLDDAENDNFISADGSTTISDENGDDGEKDDNEDEDDGALEGKRIDGEVLLALHHQKKYPLDFDSIGALPSVGVIDLKERVIKYLRSQLEGELNAEEPILLTSRPYVYHSATAIFYSPSDPSGDGGMRREMIRASPSWRKQGPRYDCVYVVTNPDVPGFKSLHVARALLFFAFEYLGQRHECALIQWFEKVDEKPDELTGMWVVEKDILDSGSQRTSVVHIDTILRAAHLIPVYGTSPLDIYHDHRKSLDIFDKFYVNKYIDSHANEVAF
ncbi:hypothetical protein SCHPADRAFT_821759 [Schizopora paradoxa]|uniref:Uncharacterized protein n=1 Tax=Schizopora paradoxa TaxID=27342 RepID=A0A0H2RYM9_9AGAM|nr:hypothetical protein SCHPADRAFT_821759 [Schizopora paradoxa]